MAGWLLATLGLLFVAFLTAQLLHSLEHSPTWAALHRTWHLDEVFTVATVLAVLFGVSTVRQRRARLRAQGRLDDIETDYREVAQDLALVRLVDRAVEEGESLFDILALLSEHTAEMFSGSRATVYLVSEDERYLVPVRATLNPSMMERAHSFLGKDIAYPRVGLTEKSWYQQTLLEGKPVLTSDPTEIRGMMAAFEGAETYSLLLPALPTLLGIRSVMSVPVILEGRPLALLDIGGRSAFRTHDLERLAKVGRELERTLSRRRLHQRLERQSRLGLLGDMAGIAAHHLNSQLTTIMGYADGLLAVLGPEAAGEDVRAIQDAAAAAGLFTERLLAFSGGFPVEVQTFQLNPFVEKLRTRLADVLGPSVTLELSLSADAGLVSADPRRVEEMLTHLARSARAALPAGGQVVLGTVGAGSEREEAACGPNDDDYPPAVLTVSDSRPRVDDEVLAQIFQPQLDFATDTEVAFALPAAYGIAIRLGGSIHARQSRFGGISFCIHLPRQAETPPPAETAPVPRKAEHQSAPTRKTVLLAEDEAALHRLVVRTLPQFDVLVAADAQEALRLSDSFPAPIDLLITDIMMPGMDGRVLARKLAERRPGLPVLFISGYAAGWDVHRSDAGTRTSYLEKPFTPDALRDSIKRLLGEA
ncbi:MAG: response regulator [Thermoleophilia bacterium]